MCNDDYSFPFRCLRAPHTANILSPLRDSHEVILMNSKLHFFWRKWKLCFCLLTLLLILVFFILKIDAPVSYVINTGINEKHPCVCLVLKDISMLHFEIRNSSIANQVENERDDISLTYHVFDEMGKQIESGRVVLGYDKILSCYRTSFGVYIPEITSGKMTTITVSFDFYGMTDFSYDLRISTLSSWRRKTVLQLVK